MDAAAPLTAGNTAKLYCLEWIGRRAAAGEPLTIVDLGCGDARNFVELLRRYPTVRYCGIDPSAAAVERARAALTGLDAEARVGRAGDVELGPAEVVCSFSVLPYVRDRVSYLDAAARALAPGGTLLLNYDWGDEVGPSPLGRLRLAAHRLGGRGRVPLGYQAPVRREQLDPLLAEAGLDIVEERFFNTGLKRVYPAVPEARRPEFARRWLELELWLNESSVAARDGEPAFVTRNLVLRRRGEAS